MPFICMPTVPNKTDEVLVQITDLFPHKTQSRLRLAVINMGTIAVFVDDKLIILIVRVTKQGLLRCFAAGKYFWVEAGV